MKHIVDIDTWSRKDNYLFFKDFLNPCCSITTEVDCTEARAAAKESGRSFFLCYLYAVARAANEIREFSFRTDKQGNVAWYDQMDIITPIAVPGRSFYTIRVPYCEDFVRFHDTAREMIKNIPSDGDPYGAEKIILEQGDYDIMHLSAVPDLYFTSVSYAQAEVGNPNPYPLMTAGKAVMREGRLVMPMSIFVNHAFVDGAHLALFFKKVEQYLKQTASV